MKTREKILKSALQLFVKTGFEGTSISQIAQKAKINPSLIYHYFRNKEMLWKEVKNHLLQKFYSEEDLVINNRMGLRNFLEHIINQRFTFYQNNPDIVRMLTWQKLEPKQKNLKGGNLFSPDNWKRNILALQERGEVKKDSEPEMIIRMISSLVSGAFSEQNLFLDKKKRYIEEIIEMLFHHLRPKLISTKQC